MITFIDESGNFMPQAGEEGQVSLVGTLTIPEVRYGRILDGYAALRRSWRIEGEIKHATLDERPIEELILCLSEYEVVLEACAIEMGHHRDEQIARHRSNQADAVIAGIEREFTPDLVQDLWELSVELRGVSNQLYAQSIAYSRVLEEALRVITLYYCQRSPTELARFHWLVDTKLDQGFERLWSFLVLPALEWAFRQRPLLMLNGADYSGFERFAASDEPPPCWDLKMIWKESLRFSSPESEPGLEIVHVLVNALRRALRGNLQKPGWSELGRLMVSKPAGQQIVPFLNLSAVPGERFFAARYLGVLQALQAKARPMLLR